MIPRMVLLPHEEVCLADFKPSITPERAEAVLREELGVTARGVRPLTGGQLSQAFAFDTDDGALVVCFNTDENGFQCDSYAAEHFASAALPIPRVVATGRVDGAAFGRMLALAARYAASTRRRMIARLWVGEGADRGGFGDGGG